MDLEQLSQTAPIVTTFPFVAQLGQYIPLPMFQNVGKALERVTNYSRKSIDRYKRLLAENPSDPKPTLFTKLFDTGKNGLLDEAIINEARNYIIAGSDTTAVTLTYLVYSVCRDKRVRDKLVSELLNLPESYTDKDLRNLPYLNHVIDEALRLHPAVPNGLPRAVPPEGAHFNGYDLPGGCSVSTQAYSLHRVPEIFPDPLW